MTNQLTSAEKVRNYLLEHGIISKDVAATQLKVILDFQNSIRLLRKDGLVISCKDGIYTYHPKRTVTQDKRDLSYIKARDQLIPEAERIATNQCDPMTLEWTQCFCAEMDRLVFETLGIRSSSMMEG